MKRKFLSILLCAALLATLFVAPALADDIVEIVLPMATLGSAPADLALVEGKINEITEAKIGVHVVIEPIPFSDLSSQQTLMISSGDPVDLVLALWEGGITNYADKGAVIELDDLLNEYGQDILEVVGAGVAGGYYDGHVYAVPNGETQGHAYGFEARKDVCEELGFSFETGTLYTIEDLEALFAAYKEKYGDGYYPIAGTTSTSEFFNYLYGHVDNMGNGTGGFTDGGLIDCVNKDDTTIVNIYGSDAYMEYARKMYDWAQKGYFSADAATNTDAGTAQVASGYYLGQFNNIDEPAMAQHASAFGTEMVGIRLVSPYATTGMYQAVLWGIASTCEHPEKAMQLLNLLYTDGDLVTLLMYGIQDQHYVVVEQGEGAQRVITFPEGVDAMNSTYYVTLGVFGNQALYPVFAPDTLDHYRLLDEYNEKVSADECKSVALKYCFNPVDVSIEYSAVSAVISQYSGAIACGSVDPETQIPAFVKALEDAGINTIIEANQAQFDAWLAEQ